MFVLATKILILRPIDNFRTPDTKFVKFCKNGMKQTM